MGNTCSCVQVVEGAPADRSDPQNHAHPSSVVATYCHDPLIHDLVRQQPQCQQEQPYPGQHAFLYNRRYKPQQQQDAGSKTANKKSATRTRLILRQGGQTVQSPPLQQQQQAPPGNQYTSTTHVYAVRYPVDDDPAAEQQQQQDEPQPEQRPEQRPAPQDKSAAAVTTTNKKLKPSELYKKENMVPPPSFEISDWVTVSNDLNIFVCDTGLTFDECNALVQTTEQVCKGHFAAYTYAKQTLGCREFPVLAQECFEPVHRVTHAIWKHANNVQQEQQEGDEKKKEASEYLHLDDREPHMVKYDVTKKERQKLDMHTDKSEWTFLIALSDGCGLDYENGGTYFEALDATIHVQRGHALIFPGRLRHCGQRITKGLRFLLVGFLVDKDAVAAAAAAAAAPGAPPASNPPPPPQPRIPIANSTPPGPTSDYYALSEADIIMDA